MIAPARTAALHALLAISSGHGELATALEHARTRLDDARDRALATDIVAGVQRWRALLDHLITGAANRRLDRLDPEIVEILRLSLYQLLYLTRVPAAAVVDDAVNLAGKAGKKSARGFVNGVLRSLARRRHDLPLPPRPADERDRDAILAYLSTTLSHPRWLVERWLDRVGFAATEAWLQFNNSSPALTLRVNRLRSTPERLRQAILEAGLEAQVGRWAPDSLTLARGERAAVELLEPLHDQFIVQDEASQLVTRLAGDQPGRRILDTCAAPGGKTTALAAAAGDALVVACDVRERRIQLLRRTLASAGATTVHVVQADLSAPLPFAPTFDLVFVDAPCSGLGTLRRDPDIKWRRQLADLGPLADTQRRMLAHAAAVVAPGGRLIYATCSSEPEENEAVAADFAVASGFARVDARSAHTGLDPALLDADGALHTTPFQHQLDAFYGVLFQAPNVAAGPPAAGRDL